MAMSSELPPPAGSGAFVDAILTFLGGGDPLAVDDIRPSLEREVDAFVEAGAVTSYESTDDFLASLDPS